MFRTYLLLAVASLIVVDDQLAVAAEDSETRLNILFIAVDDLRTELGCYGVDQVHSPNIDQLAASGTLFERAYCQQAVCSPSRTSLMTGCRPDTTRVYDLQTHFRDNLPDVVTLPQHFKKHGYYTIGLGKIYHGGLDDEASWSEPAPRFRRPMYALRKNRQMVSRKRSAVKGKRFGSPSAAYNATTGPAFESADVADNQYSDGAIADGAIQILRELKDKPFFLAVGFLKPHLPFVAPKRYWDQYQADAIPKALNPFPPKDSPQMALSNWGELRAYHGIPQEGPLPDEQARQLKHGYYACVSYVDAQIGRLLAELDRLQLRGRTVIILWGDHGWKLGEHAAWCKHTNFENDTRVPLICAAPEQKAKGSTKALVEFVDIYPTLCELAGLPLPKHVQGTSFAPLLQDSNRAWKSAAFSQYPRGPRAMGYSMRTDRYRFTRWIRRNGVELARELYDHQTDPQENVNIAERRENNDLVEALTAQSKAGWKAARPTGQ